MAIDGSRMNLFVADIICCNRSCGKCKLYEYEQQHGTWCQDTPLQFQLNYARELLRSGDELLNSAINSDNFIKDKSNKEYKKAISLIKIGGVQYV